MCGLSDKDLQCIIDAVKKYEEIDKAVIFGSRAYDYLDEVVPLSYFFDLLHYEKLHNEN